MWFEQILLISRYDCCDLLLNEGFQVTQIWSKHNWRQCENYLAEFCTFAPLNYHIQLKKYTKYTTNLQQFPVLSTSSMQQLPGVSGSSISVPVQKHSWELFSFLKQQPTAKVKFHLKDRNHSTKKNQISKIDLKFLPVLWKELGWLRL